MESNTLERQSQPRSTDGVRSAVIQQKLDSLSGKIRRYVVVHGLMLAVIWICLSYWFVLALDYLPVLLGQAELSQALRLALLIAMIAGAGWILYRYVFQRFQKRLSPESLALLLERRFPQLNDALATVVNSPQEADDDLLDKTQKHAEGTLEQISLADVFNYRPIIIAGIVTLTMLGSIGWFATANRDAFATSFRRMYMLKKESWPRDCMVQLLGIKFKHEYSIEGLDALSQLRSFDNDAMYVGTSSSISLLVQAELPNAVVPRRRLPSRCEFLYQTTSGKSGRLTMSKVGGSKAGFQNYALDSDVLQSVTEDLTFYIRGDDHRIGPFKLNVIEPPLMQNVKVDCQYPEYLSDDDSDRFTRRRLSFASGMQLPIGTFSTVQAACDRPLKNVWIIDQQNQLEHLLKKQIQLRNDSSEGSAAFDVALPALEKQGIAISVVLQDVNGVFSRSPQPIRFQTRADSPPRITARLQGIGTAVTPNAKIQILAEVQEDYGLEQVWRELTITQADQVTEPIQTPIEMPYIDRVDTVLDLQKEFANRPLPTDETQISLALIAKDRFNLNKQSNIGKSESFVLDVVSSDQLLRILERDEAEQRARLEQIYREVNEAREHIVRASHDERSASSNEAGFEPGDEGSNATESRSTTVGDEALQLRQLFVQRALLQTQKSTAELQGVADSFRNLRLQLINNRIDAEDRKQRLEKKVVGPLEKLTLKTMKQLEAALRDGDVAFRELANRQPRATGSDSLHQHTSLALEKVDQAIQEIRDVLDSLLKFETQNELLDIVRRLLEEQQQLEKRTDALREKEAFDDIFNK